MKLLNRTTEKGKQYSILDARKFLEPKQLGLDSNYYGGRIKRIASTSTKGMYLLLDELSNVFDIMVDEDAFSQEVEDEPTNEIEDEGEEVAFEYEDEPTNEIEDEGEEVAFEYEEIDYTELRKKELKAILDDRGIEYEESFLKQQLIDLLSE